MTKVLEIYRKFSLKLKTILINSVQSIFQKVEKLGNHHLNSEGIWKSDYKLLHNSIYQSLRSKLDDESKLNNDTFLVLPNENYKNEWEELKKYWISNEKLLKTLNSFFGGKEWKIGIPICWRLRPLETLPSHNNTSDGARFWHLDDIRQDYLKLFINLMDVQDAHGPFMAISASDSKKIIKKYGKNRYNLKDNDFGYQVINSKGPIGSSIFCTTSRCFHRGGFQEKNYNRDMLQVHFVLKKPFINFL